MSATDQLQYPEMYRHYLIAVATGLSHHRALTYAHAQIRTPTDIAHLRTL